MLVNDHSVQAEVAAKLAAQYRLVVSPTVMLETEWVLRSRYGLPRAKIVELFEGITEFDGFIVTEREQMCRAIHGFGGGMDFADALHVCLMVESDSFVTFDKDLVRLAKQHFSHLVVELAQ
jgi:predicted nucleic-acid-binding protein